MAYTDDPTRGLLLTEHDPNHHDLYSCTNGQELIYRCTCGWESGWCDARWKVATWAQAHLKEHGARLPRGDYTEDEL